MVDKIEINERLRYEVKQLKAFQDISYKDIAELLEMNTKSFYLWLRGHYKLGLEKQHKLTDIISDLKEWNKWKSSIIQNS